MAMNRNGLLYKQESVQPSPFRGQQQAPQPAQASPPPKYGGLTSGFNMYNPIQYSNASNDSDVSGANANQDWLSQVRTDSDKNHTFVNENDWKAHEAYLNLYNSRINLKNELGNQINQSPEIEKQGLSDVYGQGNATLAEGLKNTKQNYNRRGLLYSGLREGGEARERGAVASQVAQGAMGVRRDAANSAEAAKAAYAAVGAANQQEQVNLARQAFQTAQTNNIARLQAMQQLGQGIGGAAGMIAGSYYNENNNQKLQDPHVISRQYLTPEIP